MNKIFVILIVSAFLLAEMSSLVYLAFGEKGGVTLVLEEATDSEQEKSDEDTKEEPEDGEKALLYASLRSADIKFQLLLSYHNFLITHIDHIARIPVPPPERV